MVRSASQTAANRNLAYIEDVINYRARNSVNLNRLITEGSPTPTLNGEDIFGFEGFRPFIEAGNVNFELFGQFDLGPTSHDLLTYSSFNSSENRSQRIRIDYTPINLINPQYVPDPTSEARTGNDRFLINLDSSGTNF